jgi:threonine dehydrogenase-like Zn-dependent dehydrogenase
MQAQRLVFTAQGVSEVESFDLDEQLGSYEVLIRNRLGLISPGTELAIFTGEHRGFERADHWARYPWSPGYANVGAIIAVGRSVQGLTPGTRVIHESTHATHARQHRSTVIAIPDDLVAERAVFFKLLGIAFTPQLVAPVAPGEHVVVLGLGMVGNLAAQLAREAGAWDVIGVDTSPGRRAKARACGVPAIDALAEAGSPSYVIEAVGLGATVRDAIRATAPRGRTILLSSPREKVEIDPYFDIHHPSKAVIGTHESARSRAERQPHDAYLLHLLESARVHVHPFVTHTLPFGEALQSAYEGLRDDPDHWMGVLIEYP